MIALSQIHRAFAFPARPVNAVSRGADTTAPFSGECLTLLCMSAKAVGLTDVSSRVTGCVVSAAQPLFWGYK